MVLHSHDVYVQTYFSFCISWWATASPVPAEFGMIVKDIFFLCSLYSLRQILFPSSEKFGPLCVSVTLFLLLCRSVSLLSTSALSLSLSQWYSICLLHTSSTFVAICSRLWSGVFSHHKIDPEWMAGCSVDIYPQWLRLMLGLILMNSLMVVICCEGGCCNCSGCTSDRL